jgi:hypothetical protein
VPSRGCTKRTNACALESGLEKLGTWGISAAPEALCATTQPTGNGVAETVRRKRRHDRLRASVVRFLAQLDVAAVKNRADEFRLPTVEAGERGRGEHALRRPSPPRARRYGNMSMNAGARETRPAAPPDARVNDAERPVIEQALGQG